MSKTGLPSPCFLRPVSPEAAHQAALNFINAHFGNAEGRGVLTSVPADPNDDDVTLVDFIRQVALQIDDARTAATERERLACAVFVRRWNGTTRDGDTFKIADALLEGKHLA